MEEILITLRKIQNDMEEQKNMISKSAEEITEKITENVNQIMDEKLQTWDTKLQKLKENIDQQGKQLYYIEKEARQRNLVFFGLEEVEKSYSDLEKIMVNFINKHFTLKIDSKDLQAIRRIGKKSDKPRPVTITFTTLGTKINILKKKRMLNDTAYYIKEDYPPQILEIRKELQTQVRIEKEKGNRAIIKYDKIVILKNNPVSTTSNKKRLLPTSPETNLNSQTVHGTQTSKKNKTLTAFTTQRSSSFSEGVVKPGMLNFLTTKNSTNAQGSNDNKK